MFLLFYYKVPAEKGRTIKNLYLYVFTLAAAMAVSIRSLKLCKLVFSWRLLLSCSGKMRTNRQRTLRLEAWCFQGSARHTQAGYNIRKKNEKYFSIFQHFFQIPDSFKSFENFIVQRKICGHVVMSITNIT